MPSAAVGAQMPGGEVGKMVWGLGVLVVLVIFLSP